MAFDWHHFSNRPFEVISEELRGLQDVRLQNLQKYRKHIHLH